MPDRDGLIAPAPEWFARDAVELAPRLLGAVFAVGHPEGVIAVRLSEVEAYRGEGEDPGSHAHRGPTPRAAVMFGPPARLYAYLSYGIHVCLNVVTGPEGRASAVLLRGGTIVEGLGLARANRPGSTDRDLARGPGRLAAALGVPLSATGAEVLAPPFSVRVPRVPLAFAQTPRTGVSGAGGGAAYPWRFVLPGDPGVSRAQRHPRAHD